MLSIDEKKRAGKPQPARALLLVYGNNYILRLAFFRLILGFTPHPQ
ncbi:hypothetical protein Krac_8451 [Ktedonobacter racemifer DSM 44963]|uniref:Uncharacterized protein n=1 Tax=Ktedonobacter racemifer DSM 44963 TaxID=485913 RepID=D6TMX6_KTERA|nr:hypothetical protein Krac_8451 [Ktedonobacter racemifer DSM 44963]